MRQSELGIPPAKDCMEGLNARANDIGCRDRRYVSRYGERCYFSELVKPSSVGDNDVPEASMFIESVVVSVC